jgi:hypothetical protein
MGSWFSSSVDREIKGATVLNQFGHPEGLPRRFVKVEIGCDVQ